MSDLKKFISIIGVAVIVALVLLGLWWVFFGSAIRKGLELEPITVEAEQVRRGSIVRRITVVGTLLADNEVVIHPEVDGKIAKINFEGGTFVKEGTPLVEIEDAVFKAKLKEAEAALVLAKADFARYTTLSEKSVGVGRKKEEAEANMLQAESRVEIANIQLNNTVIRAPFAGIVGLKQYSVGSFVDIRTELLTIVDVDPIKVDFRIPAVYLKYISRGQNVKVTVDSFPNEEFEAKIDAIDAKIDQTANSILVRGVIPNPRGRLKPGLFARVSLVVGAKEDVLLIPESAVLSKGDEEYVFRVVEVPVNGVPTAIAFRVPVTTGLSEGGIIEIVRGLSEGDQIITIGLSKVRDQFPVRVVEDVEAENEIGDQSERKIEKKPVDEEENESSSEQSQQTESQENEPKNDSGESTHPEEKIKQLEENKETESNKSLSDDQSSSSVEKSPPTEQAEQEKQNSDQESNN